MTYAEYIESKRRNTHEAGFAAYNLSTALFPFQHYCVETALRKGRFCLFEDCGLGKTLQQLSWADAVVKHTGRDVLILAPFAVTEQTISEGRKFGIDVWEIYGTLFNTLGKIYITNYEQLDNIDTSNFAGVVLDESSILKNFEGATRNLIIDKFQSTPYKLACSATPSPNDPMELGNHAEFMGVMTRSEMLAMYFVHDGGNTSAWRLKGHSVDDFWRWVGSWAIMISKPSDIGFSDVGYDLPPLNIIEKQIVTDNRSNGMLFNDIAVNATNFNAELRETKKQRMQAAADIVNGSPDNFIVWIKQDEEADLLKKLIPDCVEVRGSMLPKIKKKRLLGFASDEFRVLVTKQKIAQFGLNYQNCHNQIFASLDFSYEALYQAIRRSYRFGQTNEVNIRLITTDTMQNVLASISKKEKQDADMRAAMIDAMKVGDKTKTINTANNVQFQLPSFLQP